MFRDRFLNGLGHLGVIMTEDLRCGTCHFFAPRPEAGEMAGSCMWGIRYPNTPWWMLPHTVASDWGTSCKAWRPGEQNETANV